MRGEILMAQDLIHGADPVAVADAASSSRGVAPGEGPPPPAEAATLALGGETVVLRPERAADAAFLERLFRACALPDLARMPADEAVKDALVRMQVASQAATYRRQFPAARFDIVELGGEPIGRIVVDPGGAAACIVDFALLPERQRRGLGSAILAGVLQWFAQPKRRVTCTVLASNEPSLRMCRRVGFVPAGADPAFVRLEW
jgi:RimJ/RimL family protein N-acetyltransferase